MIWGDGVVWCCKYLRGRSGCNRLLRLVVIAWATHVVVEEWQTALRAILRQRQFIQPMFQNGIYGGIADGIGDEGPAASGFNTVVSILLAQSDNAQRRPECLLGMWLALDQCFDQFAGVRAN